MHLRIFNDEYIMFGQFHTTNGNFLLLIRIQNNFYVLNLLTENRNRLYPPDNGMVYHAN